MHDQSMIPYIRTQFNVLNYELTPTVSEMTPFSLAADYQSKVKLFGNQIQFQNASFIESDPVSISKKNPARNPSNSVYH